MPKYPNIKVKLSGEDGNAYSIMGRITLAMRRAGIKQAEITKFRDEAMSGDYDHLLQTAMATVEIR